MSDLTPVWIPFVSALLGSMIGSVTTLISIAVRERSDDRRERRRLAIDVALRDFEHSNAYSKELAAQGQTSAQYPVVAYIHYHLELMKLADSGEITRESIEKLHANQRELLEAIDATNAPKAAP